MPKTSAEAYARNLCTCAYTIWYLFERVYFCWFIEAKKNEQDKNTIIHKKKKKKIFERVVQTA